MTKVLVDCEITFPYEQLVKHLELAKQQNLSIADYILKVLDNSLKAQKNES